MDYTALALEQHTETLKRLLSYVLVYIGLADDTHQAMRFIRKTATQWDAFSGGGGGADALARAFHAMGDRASSRGGCITGSSGCCSRWKPQRDG